jgi:hypothetical protein
MTKTTELETRVAGLERLCLQQQINAEKMGKLIEKLAEAVSVLATGKTMDEVLEESKPAIDDSNVRDMLSRRRLL